MTGFQILAVALAMPAAGAALALAPRALWRAVRRGKARPDEWQVRPVRDLTEAEDLMDLLESRGTTERELVVRGDSAFAVRWR